MPYKPEPRFPYGIVSIHGHEYYRAFVHNEKGKKVALYGKTLAELCDKVYSTDGRHETNTASKASPTVKEYCQKWLFMQSAQVRANTMIDYTSKVKNYIIKPLGDMYITDVTADDIKLALVAASKKSASVFKSVNILYRCIFNSAEESRIIKDNPTRYISKKTGGIPQKEREALTDEQVQKLLDAIRDLPPYVFVMLGLFAGLRREEILGLQWDCVFLDVKAPYLVVHRAWHTEHNRPIVSTELKTRAAKRSIPLPDCLAECLREARSKARSLYVISNSDGEPLSYTQFRQFWRYIVVRTAKPRITRKPVGGKYVKYILYPELGQKARNNGHVVYSLDFEVTPHMLRHTYITNLIAAGVDPKTVQYLAGHQNSQITMDIYAKVKYNRPNDLIGALADTFDQWNDSVPAT